MPNLTPIESPPIHASASLVGFNAGEVQVVIGQTKMAVGDMQPDMRFPIGGMFNWVLVLEMSPATAETLRQQLDEALRRYVEQFGPLPRLYSQITEGDVIPINGRGAPRSEPQTETDDDPTPPLPAA